MSFILGSSRHGNYQEIPSIIPEPTRRASVSLEGILTEWQDRDEIKFQQANTLSHSGHYYTDSRQPEGVLENSRRFLARLVDFKTQSINRDGIHAVLQDLKNDPVHSSKLNSVEQDLRVRKFLGQPLSVGTLKKSLSLTAEQKTPSGHFLRFPGLSLFGKKTSSQPQETAIEAIIMNPSQAKKKGYTRISENKTLPTKPPLKQKRPSSYQA